MTMMNFFRLQRDPRLLAYTCHLRPIVAVFFVVMAAFFCSLVKGGAAEHTSASEGGKAAGAPDAAAKPHPGGGSLYILEYRVEGAHHLSRGEVERAVYPFLGPGRSADDVEAARAALEKVYRGAGFQTVTVQIPEQSEQVVKRGIVMLQVVEPTVGRLRVKGSRYFLPSEIVKKAPSLREGTVMNFNDISRDIVALNKNPDRSVKPSVRPGVEPNTIDVDLEVNDKLPLHGSLELNNRYSANTTPLRVNGSVNYDNLWQLNHSLGFSFQVAPQDVSEVKVFSGYYTFRFSDIPWLNLMLQGTKQDSNVSTLGGSAVAGRGEFVGPHAVITLPSLIGPNGNAFFHSINVGIDYKHFDQNIVAASSTVSTPITYYPISAAYSATWIDRDEKTRTGCTTDFTGAVNLHLRGMGSSAKEFDDSRYNAESNYIYFRGDLSHTRDLPWGLQAYGRVQGQISGQPLINSEQFSAGGLETVRGYLESAVVGDNALCGTLELRSPSLGTWMGHRVDEWRFFVFTDAGVLTLRDPLAEQTANFRLASYGVGSRIRFRDHFNGACYLGIPLIGQGSVEPHDLLLTFRLWADF